MRHAGRANYEELTYEMSPRGNPILVLNYNRYVKNRESKRRVFWRCTKYYQSQVNCPGSVAITKADEMGMVSVGTTRQHNEICEARRRQAELDARTPPGAIVRNVAVTSASSAKVERKTLK